MKINLSNLYFLGLFHKAICQSGVVLNPWAKLTINPKRFAYQMCSLLGNKSRDHKELVDFLRHIDCEKLIEIQNQLLTDEVWHLNKKN